MPWVLKKNAPEFDVVDGPMAGKQFRKGITYTDVPPGDKAKFEEVKATPKPAAAVQAPAKTETKKNAGYEAKEWPPVKAPTKNKLNIEN